MIEDIQRLVKEGFTDWSSLGVIKAVYEDDLVLLSYGRGAEWNEFECLCRGLILNIKTGEVVARPFDKFFNWFEGGRKATGHMEYVVEKCDGSLGILYRDNGQYKIATRGSFESEQALHATELLQNYDLSDLPDEWTLLFEIIYPDNRIVVDYGARDELVLLAIRNRFTGEYLPFFEKVIPFAQEKGFTLPWTYHFNNIVEILEATGELCDNEEGFVAVFSDGSRWKFKGDRYLEIHKLLNALTPKAIKQHFLAGTYNDMIDRLPEDLQIMASQYYLDIVERVAQVLVTTDMLMIAAPDPEEDRKAFAEYAKNFPDYTHYLFAKANGKLTEELIANKEF